MEAFSARGAELRDATARAIRKSEADQEAPVIGVTMSGLMKHGGLYTLADQAMMERRFDAMMTPMLAGAADTSGVLHHISNLISKAAAIPTYFFYHIVDRPYQLHSRLVSYLTFPNRHLNSPPGAMDRPIGKTYSQANTPSPEIPAAFTFVGQFIDHDLTLNAMNLFDDQKQNVPSQASPLIDLDNVYGARLDENHPGHAREIPKHNGYFRLRAVTGGGYDVCRRDLGKPGQHKAALIGDKRNDDNQILLQIHILVMRLHNAFRHLGMSFEDAKTQTILHWQSMVANEYLNLVCDPVAVTAVLQRLTVGNPPLVHRPGLTICHGTTLGMPHEFAIGFRFGHSQLRSEYKLNPQHNAFRLFDSLSDGSNDLQGGKCLDHQRVVDWPFFLGVQQGQADIPSNLIDTQVNEVAFDLPESTIPDDIKLVSNLPFRNLARSDSIGLCSGEDLAKVYADAGYNVTPLSHAQVEPDGAYHAEFRQDERYKHHGHIEFRTPLWYYLLREAEVAREAAGANAKGSLGPLGSHLVAEVILSAIWYATPSFFQSPAWTAAFPTSGNSRAVELVDIANFVNATPVTTPGCLDDVCS